MGQQIVAESVIAALKSNSVDSDDELFEALGTAVLKQEPWSGTGFAPNPREVGQRAWRKMKPELQEILCDRGKPKIWAEELVSGDIRNLVVGIATALASSLDVTLGIAVPAAALVVKRGITGLCKGNSASEQR